MTFVIVIPSRNFPVARGLGLGRVQDGGQNDDVRQST
jgi:hypothetical protein